MMLNFVTCCDILHSNLADSVALKIRAKNMRQYNVTSVLFETRNDTQHHVQYVVVVKQIEKMLAIYVCRYLSLVD